MIHFFDIGANTGSTFDTYLQHHPELFGSTVYCFEPSPRHLGALLQKAEQYGDRFKIVVCPFGLSDSRDVLLMHEKVDPQGDSFVPLFTSGLGALVTDRDAKYWVFALTYSILDFMIRFVPPPDTAIVKIDAECSEYVILSDLLRAPATILRQVTQLLVEFHVLEGYDPEKYKAALQAAGRPIENWDL